MSFPRLRARGGIPLRRAQALHAPSGAGERLPGDGRRSGSRAGRRGAGEPLRGGQREGARGDSRPGAGLCGRGRGGSGCARGAARCVEPARHPGSAHQLGLGRQKRNRADGGAGRQNKGFRLAHAVSHPCRAVGRIRRKDTEVADSTWFSTTWVFSPRTCQSRTPISGCCFVCSKEETRG